MPEQTIQELESKLKKCELDNHAKSEFLSMIAHQLRTPLSGIKWTFKMLLDGDLGSFTEEQKDIVRKGAESNERMLKLLEELIVANQNEEWEFQYNLSKVDLEQIAEKVITEFLEEARVKEVSISFKRPNKPLPLVAVDPEKIALVFQNLLENAIKYSSKNNTVSVGIDEENNTVQVAIKDSGIGIPKAQQEKIFEKFFRADNAKIEQKAGTGLGLFTAKKIVEKHGGKIWFESNEGKGTTFFFTVPIST